MITKRDIAVAALSAAIALGAVAFAGLPPNVMSSTLVEWNSITPTQTDVGTVRQFFRAPTATLDELELHVTTLNPGIASHAPHQHANEELVIIKEGTVEVLVDGRTLRAGPGSVVFNASNQMHALRNVGTTPATYHVINWKSSKTPPQ
jgi:XRE family transcriptional regulator, regulator of sulfur utilization